MTVVATDPNGLTAAENVEITVTPAMRAPELVGAIPAELELLRQGDTISINVSPYFRDPEGSPLAYAVRISDAAVATVSVSGGVLSIVGGGAGTATITITVSNLDGLTTMQTMRITVLSTDRAIVQYGSDRAPEFGEHLRGDQARCLGTLSRFPST